MLCVRGLCVCASAARELGERRRECCLLRCCWNYCTAWMEVEEGGAATRSAVVLNSSSDDQWSRAGAVAVMIIRLFCAKQNSHYQQKSSKSIYVVQGTEHVERFQMKKC